MADRAIVAFHGGVGLVAMTTQRFRHARRYAIGRSAGLGTMARLARVAASPLVPPLLCLRAARAVRSRGWKDRGRWVASLPGLAGWRWPGRWVRRSGRFRTSVESER